MLKEGKIAKVVRIAVMLTQTLFESIFKNMFFGSFWPKQCGDLKRKDLNTRRQ